MAQPTWRDVMFSIKTFGAAALALYVAFALELTQPTWAMLTVFVVSQPIAGMVVAKSLFRVIGTVVGATVALALVAAFAQSPSLFLTCLALWIGAGTFTSVLLRDAPAAYGAMLSGYTAAIIGVPAALAPETAFDYAVGRCLEIILGIGCATLVSQVVFPRTAGVALKTSVNTTTTAVADWMGDVLRGESQEDKVLADQRKMIADVIALDNLRIYAGFDTPSVRAAGDVVRHLQGNLLSLLSILVSINDRLELLRNRAPAKYEALLDILGRTAARLQQADRARIDPDLEAATEQLRQEALRRLPTFDDMVRDHETIPVRNVLLRMGDLLATWQRIIDLREALLSDRPVSLSEAAPSTARYRDVTFALVAGSISATAVLVTAAFWIASGWSQGSTAVIFSGVICSILGALDDPATSAANFLRMTLLSVIFAAIYMFAVFPAIDGFTSLIIALVPFYLPFGIVLGLPRIGLKVTPLGLNLIAFLGLTNTRSPPDLAGFANSSLALLGGIGIGILMFRLLRPLGVEWMVRRIRRGVLRDLERLAVSQAPVSRDRFASRMFDRINALFSRLDASQPDQRALMRSTLAALRVSFNIMLLKTARNHVARDVAVAIDRVLDGLGYHFGALRSGAGDSGPLHEIDDAVVLLLAQPSQQAADLLTSLIAISGTLYRHADLFGSARQSPVPAVLRQGFPA
ncbi:FUSC family protein [Microvirga massiliensis]|uniref:FUSC family protein n=1 Tax=Microvirga massiliensis TaxID=1033741 RepID=UPI00065FE902|nr:FUSC family protein [Microvirga massiliensis]